MRGLSRGILVVLLVGVGSASAAPPRPGSSETDRRIRADVERASPAAAEAFDQGNAAREANRPDEAVAAYRRASELAPGVDHPHRRACSVLVRNGRVDEGVKECEAAIALAPASPYNKLGLAEALTLGKRAGVAERALQLAHEAIAELPGDPTSLAIWCQIALRLDRTSEFASCVDRLDATEPSGIPANVFGTLRALGDHDFARARQRVAAAKAAGLDDETHRRLLATVEAAEADAQAGLPTRLLWAALWTFAIWLAVMGILLVAGYALSRSTLRAVGKAASGTVGERRLRQLYKVVLLLCGIYFYLSIPILLLGILVAGGGAVYSFFAIGMIPIKLVLVIGIVVVATIGAILRSLFVRAQRGSLGHRIDLDRHPRLRELVGDVAGAVGTRPASAVYLTPGTDMGVTERLGLWASLRGAHAERSLIMGVGLFEGMTQVQLRSVLAHEHGHFRNADTAGGGFALAVRRSLVAMIIRLAQAGVAGALNPVWWFLRAYYRIYLGVSQGASRLQEVLADRWAIQAYGSAAFVAGYRHVVARSVQFDHQVNATIHEVVDRKQPLPNLYQYHPQTAASADREIASAIDTQMARDPSAYDSHPSPRQRIEWAEALAIERVAQPGDDESIWALFEDRDDIERAMTAEVRRQLRANHGLQIAESAAPAAS